MITLSPQQIINALSMLTSLELANVANAVQNEVRKREKASNDGKGNFNSTEKL